MSRRNRITQVEARALKKRVAELERMEDDRRGSWHSDYPGGTHIGTVLDSSRASLVRVARQLRHAVVAVNSGEQILLYALPLAKEPPP